MCTCDGLQHNIQRSFSYIEELIEKQLDKEQQKMFLQLGEMFLINPKFVFQVDIRSRKLTLSNFNGYYSELIIPKSALEDFMGFMK